MGIQSDKEILAEVGAELNQLLDEVAIMRDMLREHVENLGEKQPWDNREMFNKILQGLTYTAEMHERWEPDGE